MNESPQVVDCTGGPISLALLHTISGILNYGGTVTIVNCSGFDMQKLGFYLMAEYEKARKAVGLESNL